MRPTTTMLLAIAAISAALTLAGCKGRGAEGRPETATAALETEDDKTLYVVGVSMGKHLASLELSPAELEIVQAGVGDTVAGVEPLVSLQEYNAKFHAGAEERFSRNAATDLVCPLLL